MNNTISIDISVKEVLQDMMKDSVEFAHLKYFLDVYLHDNYQVEIVRSRHYTVHDILKSTQPYHHSSYSNCVEWVFNNCEVIKEKL